MVIVKVIANFMVLLQVMNELLIILNHFMRTHVVFVYSGPSEVGTYEHEVHTTYILVRTYY